MDPMTGLMIGSSVLGGLGGKGEAKRSRQPTTTTKTAYRPGDVDWLMDRARSEVENYQSPGNQFSEWMFGQLTRDPAIRGGGRGQGGGAPQGGGGSEAALAQAGTVPQQGGGGRGGRRGPRVGRGEGKVGQGYGKDREFYEYLSGLQATPNEALASVIGGEFLDFESNPYMQQRLDAMQTESAEDLERGLGMMAGQASGFGRTGSGAAALQEALAFEESQEALDQARAGMLGQAYESERDRMMQGLGMLSAETQALRGNVTDVRQSRISANAQRAAARMAAQASIRSSQIAAQAQQASARISANASKYGADKAYSSAMANNARLQRESDRAYKLGMFDRAVQLDNMAKAEAMAGMQMLQQYSNVTQPYQLGLGTTTQQGPGVSNLGGAAQGLLGGGMQGLGLGLKIQDAGGFGSLFGG